MNEASPDFTWLFLKMMAGLLLVLVLAFVLIRYVMPRGRFFRRGRSEWVQVLDRAAVESRKNLYLVKLAGRFFVLGAAEQSLALICELTKEEGERVESQR